MARLAPPRAVAGRLAEEDLAYIRRGYRPLRELAAARSISVDRIRRLIAERRLPQPAYVLDDGTEMVAPDYLDLMDQSGIDGMEVVFTERYRAAARSMGRNLSDQELDAAWKDYLTGAYGVCLWEATPENIARKDLLVDRLETLLGRPRPDDPGWRSRVRTDVEDLDRLERPGAPLDDARWGRRSSRSRLIEDPQERYPWIFGSGGGAI